MKNVYVPNVGETAKIVTSMIKRNLRKEKIGKNKINRKEKRPVRIEKIRNGKLANQI